MLKKTLVVLGFQICVLITSGQNKFNTDLLKELQDGRDKVFTFLIKGNIEKCRQELADCQGVFNYSAGDIASVTLPLSRVEQFAKSKNVSRIELVQQKLRVLDDSSLRKNNINKIHNGAFPLTGSYTGKGVLIGIIDTGTDIDHPDFKDSTGKSRIVWLWDQRSVTASNTPQPYSYGQEWTALEIDSGICTHDDYSDMSHGTKVAGIAAGNGASAGKYKGIAPEAQIMTVAIDFNHNGPVITDAVDYLVNKANAMGQPLVINISLGDYFGSHDGKDLQAKMIDNLLVNAQGRALVAAAGNAGQYSFHLGYDLAGTDTNFTWINNTASTITNFKIYGDSADFKHVKFSVGAHQDTTFNYKGHIPFNAIDSVVGLIKKDSLIVNNKRIGIIETSGDFSDGVYTLDVTIKADSSNLFWSFETTGTGRIDAWDFNFVANGLPTVAQLPRIIKYRRPDTLQTMCTSFQCSEQVITVGNYTNRLGFTDVSSTFTTFPGTDNDIFPTSSLGPTRTGKIKPDITASGENIATTGALPILSWLIQNYPYVVTEDSMHMIFGGTSASAPVVTGLVALYFEKHQTATAQEIKNDIINCALKDSFTGTVPNNLWGNGKLDGFGALVCSMPSTNGMNEHSQNKSLTIYPNPANENVMIESAVVPCRIMVTDLSGRKLVRYVITRDKELINVSLLNNGIYFLQIEGTASVFKLVISD